MLSTNDRLKTSCKYAFAALNASFITHILHPLDVIKIRFQSIIEKNVIKIIFHLQGHDGSSRNIVPKYQSIGSAFNEIYRSEGMRGLYKGLIASIFGQSLSRVIFFTM